MLKPYDKPEDIPEALREHYSRREDGKYHADIPNEHPAVKHNATLLSEKQAAEEKARKAEVDLESAKASGLPRGHVAVPSAKAALLEQYEPLGTPDELKTMKGEHEMYKTKVAASERREHLDLIRKDLGWSEAAVDVLGLIPDLPEIERRDGRDKDGKDVKIPTAKVKTGENSFTDKPFADYFAEKHAVLLPSVVVSESSGTKVFGSTAGGGAASSNEFDAIRNEIKGSQQAAQPKDNASVIAALGGQRLAANT